MKYMKKGEPIWSDHEDWSMTKDGDIQVYKDINTNIVAVVNHKTKTMHASDMIMKEIEGKVCRRKNKK